jgi:hypothetical protein
MNFDFQAQHIFKGSNQTTWVYNYQYLQMNSDRPKGLIVSKITLSLTMLWHFWETFPTEQKIIYVIKQIAFH